MIYLLTLLIIMQSDIDWSAAEKAVRQERARTAAFDTMPSDTTLPDYLHFKAPKKEKKSIHNVLILDTKDIDSVQAIEDSLKNILCSDNQFIQIYKRNFTTADCIGFFNHLLHYKIKDTAQVQRAANIYLEILNCQYQENVLILEDQTSDVRATIYAYIKKNRGEATVVGKYLYDITK